MAISPDVLATALQELMPAYSELFVSWHPVLEKLVSKGNLTRETLKGPWREFVVVTDGPGDVTLIQTGSEVIAGGRHQNAVRGSTYAPRMIYAFDVPGKDLAEANGEMDLARILKNYPELALSDFHERIADQVATGNGNNVGGFVTLNGDRTYIGGGPAARQGAFRFLTPAAQAAAGQPLRFGLDSATTPGWINQYGNITSFATNGKSTMRRVYYTCSRQGKTLGPVDLLLGDEDSYLNYIEDLDDQVRVSKVEGDKAPPNVRQGTKFLDADFYLEDAIDTAQFGSAAAPFPGRDGVIYFMKSATWHAYTLGHDANRETKGDFAVRGPFRIPEQDLWRYEIVLMMGIHTTQLRANGVVEGGAIP